MNILITGGGTGIGRGLVLHLAKNTATKIIIVGRRLKPLQEVQSHNPEQISFIQADVSSEQGRDKILQAINKQEKLTHVIHNAGIGQPICKFEDINLHSYRQQHAINTEAPLFLTQSLLPRFAENARVLFISSGAAVNLYPDLTSYSISKAALEMLCRCLQSEFSERKIYFASLRPGAVDTAMYHEAEQYSEKIAAIMAERKKVRNLLSPSITASFIAWVLFKTTNTEFEKNWNYLDETDQSRWKLEVMPSIS